MAGCRAYRRDDLERLAQRTRARATGAGFDENAKRRQGRMVAPCARKRLNRADRIGEDVELSVRPGGDELSEPARPANASDLVGENETREPGAQHHRRLTDVSDGRAPSAALDERPGEIGRHRRLGVRRDLDALEAGVSEHEVAIVQECGLVEREHGQRHSAVRGPPIPASDFGGGESARARRHAADAVVEDDRFAR